MEESEEDDPGSDIDRKKGVKKLTGVRKKIVFWVLQVKGVQSKLLLIEEKNKRAMQETLVTITLALRVSQKYEE